MSHKELPIIIKTPKRVKVKISAKCVRMLFVQCDSFYVKNNCKGNCCRNSNKKLNVTIAPRERHYIESIGGRVRNGFLLPNEDGIWCPFQKENGLCAVHKKAPVGCMVSPFNITVKNTVVIRNRNLSMKCHKKGILPAYHVFKRSFDVMFGKRESKRICVHFDKGGSDVYAYMFGDVWEDLQYNLKIRKGKTNANK